VAEDGAKFLLGESCSLGAAHFDVMRLGNCQPKSRALLLASNRGDRAAAAQK
jgi:hypothetical protein